MADGIRLYPSSDIHLILPHNLDSNPSGININEESNALQLKVYSLQENASDYSKVDFIDITDACEFSPYPGTIIEDDIVKFDPVSKGLICPQRKGQNLYSIYWFDGSIHHYQIFRVQVHKKIDGWWFGDDQITLHKIDPELEVDYNGEALPTIYATFDVLPGIHKGDVGDISGHGYVKLTAKKAASSISENFQIENSDPVFSRLTGIYETDDLTPAKLEGEIIPLNYTEDNSFLGGTQDLSIHVKSYEDLGKNRLKNIMYNGDPNEKFNLLFLSEGFPIEKEDMFSEAVRCIIDRMFEKPRHHPFPLLKQQFNAWQVFSPSSKAGLTDVSLYRYSSNTGYLTPYQPIIAKHPEDFGVYFKAENLLGIIGTPRNTDIYKDDGTMKTEAELRNEWSTKNYKYFNNSIISTPALNAWKKRRVESLLQSNDTFLHFNLDYRQGEHPSTKEGNKLTSIEELKEKFQRWYQPIGGEKKYQKPIKPDPRKYTPFRLKGYSIYKLLSKLTDLNDENLGDLWSPSNTNKNMGLVCVVGFNDVSSRAINFTNEDFFTICEIKAKDNTHPLNNFYPSGGFSGELSNNLKLRKEINKNNIKIKHGELTDTYVHELGHSFNLGDEYESFEGVAIVIPEDVDNRFDNLVHLKKISKTPSEYMYNVIDYKIDRNKIKWDVHRIYHSDTVMEILDQNFNTKRIKIQLNDDRIKIKKWKKVKNKNLDVHFRVIHSVGPQFPMDEWGIFKVFSIDIPNSSITLEYQEQFSLPDLSQFKGSLIYSPLLLDPSNPDSGNRSLIHEDVKSWLDYNEELLTRNFNCKKQSKPDYFDLTAMKKLKHKFNPIGLYEGGMEYTCYIVRPAGACKMRSHRTGAYFSPSGNSLINEIGEGNFCFVCKYILTNRISAGKLDELDKQYPDW